MSELYLKGYDESSYPVRVSLEQAEELVAVLRASGAEQIGSCMTTEPAQVRAMLELVDGSRRYGSIATGHFAGPLVLNGVVQRGNVIGIWEQNKEESVSADS